MDRVRRMTMIDKLRRFMKDERSTGMSVSEPDMFLAFTAIEELAQRQDVLLRLLQGLTGYMKNGCDDLPIWALAQDNQTPEKNPTR